MIRVVLDTNQIVTATISSRGAAAEILRHWRQGEYTLLVSEAILAEYEKALSYASVQEKHGLSKVRVRQLVDQFRRTATVVEPTSSLTLVDDPDDDKFIECAIGGEADFIVSKDEHLLKLRDYQGIRIVLPRTFLHFLDRAS